jgi:hypothetical protein
VTVTSFAAVTAQQQQNQKNSLYYPSPFFLNKKLKKKYPFDHLSGCLQRQSHA